MSETVPTILIKQYISEQNRLYIEKFGNPVESLRLGVIEVKSSSGMFMAIIRMTIENTRRQDQLGCYDATLHCAWTDRHGLNIVRDEHCYGKYITIGDNHITSLWELLSWIKWNATTLNNESLTYDLSCRFIFERVRASSWRCKWSQFQFPNPLSLVMTVFATILRVQNDENLLSYHY